MPLLTRKAIVLAKIESVYGTDSVPVAGTDDILVRASTPRPLQAQFVDRALIRPYLGRSEQLPAAVSAELEIEVELAGGGAAGTAPRWGTLLRGCGFSQTINAAVSTVYAPISTAFESLSIRVNQDGVLHNLTGARGSVRLALTALQVPVLRFRFVGIYNTITDAAQGTPTFTGWQKPLPVNRVNTPSFSLHAYAGVLQSLELDLANQIVFRSLVGFEGVLLTDRQPGGSISMEATTVAAKDWWTSIRSATTGALALTHGTAAGNTVALAAPNVQILEPSYADSDGVVMLNGNLAMIPGAAGNNELSITVT